MANQNYDEYFKEQMGTQSELVLITLSAGKRKFPNCRRLLFT